MAKSKVDICNLSLDLLSGGEVSNIDAPTTPNEDLCQRWYDVSRRKVLREHPWHFAKKRAILAASSTAPLFGYTTAFPVPNDFIRVLELTDSDGIKISNNDYTIENNSILLSTSATQLRLVYIYDIEDVIAFDSLFVPYFATDLALWFAFKITQSDTVATRVNALKAQLASMSKAISGQERPPIKVERSKVRDARYSGYTDYSHRVVFE